MVNSVSIIGRFDPKQESFKNIEDELKKNLDKYVGVNKNKEPNNKKCDLHYLLHKKAGKKITTCSENNKEVTQSNVKIAKQLVDINEIFDETDESKVAGKIKTILTNLQVTYKNRSFIIAYFPYTIKNGIVDVVDGKILHIVFDENDDYTRPIQTKNVNIKNNKIYQNVLPDASAATVIQKNEREDEQKWEEEQKRVENRIAEAAVGREAEIAVRMPVEEAERGVEEAERGVEEAERGVEVAVRMPIEEVETAAAPIGIVKTSIIKSRILKKLEKIKEKIKEKIEERSWFQSMTHADRETHNDYKTEMVKQINVEIVRYNELYKDKPRLEKDKPLLEILVYNINKTRLRIIEADLKIIISKISANKNGGKLTRKIKSNTVKSTSRKGGRKTNKSKKISKNRRQTRRRSPR